MKLLRIICLILLTGHAEANFAADNDRVVLLLDGEPVHHVRIACPASMVHDAERCHSLEQQRLDHIVWQHWIVAAAQMYGVSLSAAEENEIAALLAAQRADNEKAAAHFHALWTAVASIQRGGDAHAASAVAKAAGVTDAELADAISRHYSSQWLDNAIGGATTAEMEKATRKGKTLTLIAAHLREYVARQASAAGITYDAAEERLWSEVATNTHTTLVDQTFHVPSKRGVLNVDEDVLHVQIRK